MKTKPIILLICIASLSLSLMAGVAGGCASPYMVDNSITHQKAVKLLQKINEKAAVDIAEIDNPHYMVMHRRYTVGEEAILWRLGYEILLDSKKHEYTLSSLKNYKYKSTGLTIEVERTGGGTLWLFHPDIPESVNPFIIEDLSGIVHRIKPTNCTVIYHRSTKNKTHLTRERIKEVFSLYGLEDIIVVPIDCRNISDASPEKDNLSKNQTTQ